MKISETELVRLSNDTTATTASKVLASKVSYLLFSAKYSEIYMDSVEFGELTRALQIAPEHDGEYNYVLTFTMPERSCTVRFFDKQALINNTLLTL